MTVTSTTTTDFSTQVLAASHTRPVLVDFWAPWCGPCRQVAPVLDQIAAEKAGALDIVKVNTDDEPALAAQFQIRSVPTLLLFRNGQPVHTVTGAKPKPALLADLAPHLA